MAGTLMSLSWMPVLVNSVVNTSGWLVITMSPAIVLFLINDLFNNVACKKTIVEKNICLVIDIVGYGTYQCLLERQEESCSEDLLPKVWSDMEQGCT